MSRRSRTITLELTRFFGAVGRDPVHSYREILTRMSIGLGDDALATARSLSIARRRAIRADRVELLLHDERDVGWGPGPVEGVALAEGASPKVRNYRTVDLGAGS